MLEEEKKAYDTDTKITIEDLTRINRHSRKVTLMLITGLLFLMIAVTILAVVMAVRSATLSMQYMLYRYIVLGESAFSPANYDIPFVLAAVSAAIGMVSLICSIVKNKKGSNRIGSNHE